MRNPAARVSDPNSFVTDPGSPIHVLHEARFNGSTLVMVETGQENIQDMIEAYAPYTDINYMLHRLTLGDTSVLSQRQALYGDFSQMPQNPVDAINLVHSAEDAFSTLPNDQKSHYNNDWRVWLNAVLMGNVPREIGGDSDAGAVAEPDRAADSADT